MKSYVNLSKGIICSLTLIFLILTAHPAPGQSTGNSEQFVSIDFNDVDISVFIKFMSELTGKNFIIDRKVKGKVTIISPSKISVKEAYKVFESVLEVNGYATVDSGKVIKIVSSPDARTKNIKTMLKEEARSPDDKVVTHLVPLRYADPAEIKRLFAPLVSKSSVILSYPPTNTLIITDVYSNIKRLLRILKQIDITGVGQMISVIPIEYGDATKLVKVMTTMFVQRRVKGKKGAGSTMKFVADERTNTLIVLASEDDTIRIKDLISQLDREVPKGKEKIHVYYLENATAEELAKVLQSLSTKQRRTSSKKGKKQAPIVSEGVNITADKATNSLIIMAEKDDYLVLEEVIRKLDIPRSMVFIECLIMEVNVNKDFKIGTEWTAGGKASYSNDKDAYIGGGFSGGGDGAYENISSVAGSALAGGAALLPQGASLGIFGEALEIGGATFYNLGAIVNAYKKDKDVHILSTPQLLTTDNEEAIITVGKNVPYQTKTGTTTTSESYNTYEYKDVAIMLKVTPQISKDRLIRLKISQEVSKLDSTAATVAERPTTLTRKIDTTVIVNDNNTIVIGGLIDDSFSKTENRIPCLGDIPGLGWLFKSQTKGREKTNLFIFLTPHVIKNEAEAKELYRQKKDHIDSIEEEERGIKMYRLDMDDTTFDVEESEPQEIEESPK
ncbi:type II secretion system secretin GspD [Desulfobacterales bacterium HSG2]|nr:type II secretion system secretin GspD [Desulfobacterales bacterium HSG2]